MNEFCEMLYPGLTIFDCACLNLSSCVALQLNRGIKLRVNNDKEAPKAVSAEKRWGIEVQETSLTAVSDMLDSQDKTEYPINILPCLRRLINSGAIDQLTGRDHLIPRPFKVWSLHQTTLMPQIEREYSDITTNDRKVVKTESKITAAIVST